MRIKWPFEFPGAHWLDEQEERAVLQVLRHGSLFRFYGPARPKFANALEAVARRFYGTRYALGVNSGTGALVTAMSALGVGPGCEVIVPAFFWVATVGAVVNANAIPVLCEVDESFTMDPADLARKITRRTKLIVAVHMAGAPANMPAILAVARRHRISVLEDCAQANGGSYRGRKLGTFGQIGMFSLQLNKNVTAGEGGLLVTNDRRLYERCNAAHDVGLPWVKAAPCDVGGHARTWGSGRRMSELIGAVAWVQLRKLPRIVRHMRASKRRLKAGLRAVPGLAFRRLNDAAGDTACFLILLFQNATQAQTVTARLQGAGMTKATCLEDYGMHVYYNIPQLVQKVPLSPAGNPWDLPQNRQSVYDYARGACPQSDALFARAVLLPIPSRLTRPQEQAAIRIIRAAVSDLVAAPSGQSRVGHP